MLFWDNGRRGEMEMDQLFISFKKSKLEQNVEVGDMLW